MIHLTEKKYIMNSIVDYKALVIFIYMSVLSSSACAEDYDEVFPTGTVWEEVYAEPGESLDTSHAIRYEIGGDTLAGGKSYRQVLRDGRKEPYCIREQEGGVWIFAEEYGKEIKLYDFNWDSAGNIYTEFLLVDAESTVVCREELQRDYASVTLDGGGYATCSKTATGMVIRGMGRVSELNRNSCLLGYKVTSPVLPGLVYSKVIWIDRGGKRIFQSLSSSEWINGAPSGIAPVWQRSGIDGRIYLPSGIARPAIPETGIYIRDGRKYSKSARSAGSAIRRE